MAQPKDAPLSIRLRPETLAKLDTEAGNLGKTRHAMAVSLIEIGLAQRGVVAGRTRPTLGMSMAEYQEKHAGPARAKLVAEAEASIVEAMTRPKVPYGSRLKKR